MKLLQKLMLSVIAASACFIGALQAEEYVLAPQDKINLRAMRWDPVVASFVNWQGVSGEYALSSGGMLMVPLAGQVHAEGRTTEELVLLLETQMRTRVGMAEPPHLAIEVIGHLPVYILGDVQIPGSYPYRPQLTAQQAMALAGGEYRLPLQNDVGTNFTGLRVQGEVQLYNEQIEALQAEQRRLLADLSTLTPDGGDAKIEPPQGLQGEILQADQQAREGQGERIIQLQETLKDQIDSLERQLELRANQIGITRKDLDDALALQKKGLTVSSRVSSLSNSLNDLESKSVDIEIALGLARQQLNRAQRDELELLDTARSNALVRLNLVQIELEDLQTRLGTAKILQAELAALGVVEEVDAVEEIVIEYSVTRAAGGAATAISGDTVLSPGDTLSVSRTFVTQTQ